MIPDIKNLNISKDTERDIVEVFVKEDSTNNKKKHKVRAWDKGKVFEEKSGVWFKAKEKDREFENNNYKECCGRFDNAEDIRKVIWKENQNQENT